MNKFLIILVALSCGLYSCKPSDPGSGTTTGGTEPVDTSSVQKELKAIQFDRDSAYQFVATQVEFGPRIPMTAAHGRCAEWLLSKCRSYMDTAFVQEAQVMRENSSLLNIKNIISSINPEKKRRFLLAAHYDTRPMADEDPVSPKTPADGANDGGSGVGVLLEIARQLKSLDLDIGVDIIFFDAEDGGKRTGSPASWCLGSQYWSLNKHDPHYIAQDAILLDMVGAKDAVFAFEGNSLSFNSDFVMEVWRTGQSLGYGKHFLNVPGNRVTDDHIFVMAKAAIPMIDIIEYDLNTGGFGHYWHTHKDNMDVIDPNTLEAVGRTVLSVIVKRDQQHS